MADPYEIARETKEAIEASRRIRASLSDDVEDEAGEWPPIHHVCRALLAQRAVVEAAVAQRKALDAYKIECDKRYSLARDCAWETYRQACSETDTAVRAYLAAKEQK